MIKSISHIKRGKFVLAKSLLVSSLLLLGNAQALQAGPLEDLQNLKKQIAKLEQEKQKMLENAEAKLKDAKRQRQAMEADVEETTRAIKEQESRLSALSTKQIAYEGTLNGLKTAVDAQSQLAGPEVASLVESLQAPIQSTRKLLDATVKEISDVTAKVEYERDGLKIQMESFSMFQKTYEESEREYQDMSALCGLPECGDCCMPAAAAQTQNTTRAIRREGRDLKRTGIMCAKLVEFISGNGSEGHSNLLDKFVFHFAGVEASDLQKEEPSLSSEVGQKVATAWRPMKRVLKKGFPALLSAVQRASGNTFFNEGSSCSSCQEEETDSCSEEGDVFGEDDDAFGGSCRK